MRTFDEQMPYCSPERRHEFVLLFDVKDGNPNGDPDAGNLPRVDPETMHGIVTDVCLKRKIRNYIDLLYRDQFNELDYDQNGYGIFVRDSTVALNTKIAHAAEQVGARQSRQRENPDIRAELCRRYYDIRMFGAVLSTGDYNAGQVRGPVQLTFARSVDPVIPLEVTITRVAITTERDLERKETEMGRKPFIPYALYRAFGFFSPALAKETGVSAKDLALLWEALLNMFEHDRSAARGQMAMRGLYVFTHEKPRGNAHAHELFERIQVIRNSEVETPRDFSHYRVIVNTENMPEGVTLYSLHE